MKERTTSGKNWKFVITVMRSTFGVIKKMLTNSRLMKLPRRTVGFTPTRKAFSAG